MNKDDRCHGALLILNELVRISSMEGEVRVFIFSLTVQHVRGQHCVFHQMFHLLSLPHTLFPPVLLSECERRWMRSHNSSWYTISTAKS